MPATVFPSVGIQTCFHSHHIVHQIVDQMVGKQIEKPGFFHKYLILLKRIIPLVKAVTIGSLLILRVDFIAANRQQKRDTRQCFRIFCNNLFKIPLRIFGANQGI